MATTTNHSYIILGSGVFGSSTALHLIRKYPSASIRLIDRNAFEAPTRVAASWDWNKVIRADYKDIVYTRMALEARDSWREDPLWKPFYHESGIYWAAAAGFAKQVLQNFAELGVEAELYSVPVEQAKEYYNGLFSEADHTGIKEVLVNKLSGWADAKDALRATIQAAVDAGVVYTEAEVTQLVFSEDGGKCTGVVTQAGETLTADRVVLCTGAYTPKLLADSAPHRPELHVGGRMVAAGVTEAVAPLNQGQLEMFADMPVSISAVHPEKGLPPAPLLLSYGRS
jgi:glycine/D-amino acid oxidase-like deaminating enzyme